MMEIIETLLKKLRCNGMMENFQSIIEAGKERQDSWLQTLQKLLEVEVEYRETRSLMYRLKLAKLPQIKTIETFDATESPLEKKVLVN